MSSIAGFINFTIEWNLIVPLIIFIIGIIGNVLSLIIFSSANLRKNPCGTYFFGLAIAHLNNLIFGLLLNNLIDAHGIDLITPTLAFCRLRFYILHSSLVLSSWFIVLAGIDRYCISSSNVNRRRFSSLKNARISVCLSILICLILYCHILAFFTVQQTPLGPVCNAQPGTYGIFYGFFFLITYSLTPPILMVIIGLATFYNTRQIYRQINPLSEQNSNITPNNLNRLRKKDRQFIKMLLIQLIFFVLLTTPIAIQKLYATFTQNIPKSYNRLFIENFFAEFVRTLTHINSALSFYLYTLSGSVFRRQLYILFSQTIKFIFGIDNRLYRRLQRIIGPTITSQGTNTQRRPVTMRQARPIEEEDEE